MAIETVYKLTDKNGRTFRDTQWGPGIEHVAPGDGPLCTGAWIHASRHPYLAVLMNPAHGNFYEPRLWRCLAEVGIDDGTKVGCTWLRTVEEIPLPQLTPAHWIRFAILCAKQVCTDPDWTAWADNWLSGKDRSMRPLEDEHGCPVDWLYMSGKRASGDARAEVMYLSGRAAREFTYGMEHTAKYTIAHLVCNVLALAPSVDLVALAREAVEGEHVDSGGDA